ncbi:MAG: tetratricopeptide repeat protein [Tepidisphaeraceae bacterium]
MLESLRIPGALLAAMLFAVHPVHVESVAWISERKNTLSGFFYLLAMFCAVRAFDLPSAELPRHRWTAPPPMKWYAAMLVCAIAAVLSKTVAGTLPAAIVMIAWWKRGRIDWRIVAWLTPLWVAAIVFSQITSYMEKTVVGATGPEWQFTFAERCLIAGRAVVFYVEKLLMPVNLTFIYPRWTIDAASVGQWAYPAAVLAALALLWLLRKRIGRGPVVAFAFFVVTIFPALGFVNIYPMRFSFVADHFQYLASIGVFVLITAIAAKLLGNSPTRLTVAAGGAAVLLVPLTFLQSQTFASPEVQWTDVLKKDPQSPIALTQLASLAVQAQRFDEAEQLYRKVLAIEPEQTESLVGLSSLLVQKGDRAGAVALAREAVRTRPGKIRPLMQLAELLQADQPVEAMDAFEKVLRIDERYEPARIALAKLLALSGRLNEAIAQCQAAIAIFPEGIQSRTLLGDLYWNQGDAARAREAYQGALAIDPTNETLRRRVAMTQP